MAFPAIQKPQQRLSGLGNESGLEGVVLNLAEAALYPQLGTGPLFNP
jgi:hypothetical protein